MIRGPVSMEVRTPPGSERWGTVRRCLLLAVGSRVLVWEASAIAARTFGLAQQPDAYNPSSLQPAGRSFGALLTFPVIRWDGDWYLAIARHGYALAAGPSPPPRTNFLPLYPLLVGALGRTGLPLAAVAAIVSIGCLVVALVALARLCELELAPGHPWAQADTTRLTLLMLVLSPVSFVFSAAYAESLYLALSVAVFLFARRGQWTRTGLAAGLASATRGPGLLLLLPGLLLYLYGPRADRAPDRATSGLSPRYRVRRDIAWLGLAPVGLVGYGAYLGLSGASPVAFVRTQRVYWHHRLAWPWTTLWDAARAAWTDAHGILTGSGHPTLFGTFPGASIATGWENLLPFLALLIAVPALIAVWRRLPAAYGAFVTAALGVNLVTPVTGWPLQSLPRYLSVLFPLFIAVGAWLATHPRARAPLLVLSAVVLAVLSAEFATWHYVA
jgi:hypothetical protein